MNQIIIVDYGMGNIESILNAFRRLGTNCLVTNNPADIAHADGIVLPGVGSFHAAMKNLHALGFQDILNEQVLHHKKPFLGICLGMQLIAEDSTESQFSKGLGWIKGHVLKIEAKNYPVPHVGWNEIHYPKHSILFNNIKEGHFFFDHSYYLQCDPSLIIAATEYEGARTASIQKENIFAVQFHPEKSQKNGAKLLRNFLNFVNDSRAKQC